MATYLITGATRGLGLALVTHLLSLPRSEVSHVFATGRSTSPPPALADLLSSSSSSSPSITPATSSTSAPRLTYIPLDVTSDSSVLSAFTLIHTTLTSLNLPLDILINNAGIQPLESPHPSTPSSPNNSIIDTSNLRLALETNVLAVNTVISTFLPLLRHPSSQRKIVTIGSTMGSFAWREFTAPIPIPSYKISKAAVHMLTLQWAQRLQEEGFVVFVVSPGRLATGLGRGDTEGAHLSKEEGAEKVLRVVRGSEGKEGNGRFRNVKVRGMEELEGGWYDGEDPGW